ncbi:MAG TPA: DUF2877 domain-containing protein [Burkholderiaceae bacterium]|nr:DUF2877 domain-containing protein [Burkholderiaceae bacterium]
MTLGVESIGHRVPRGDFAGRVHSAFAHACNIACGGSLLTVVARRGGNGPTSLLLGAGAPPDLRRWFDVGETLQCRRGAARGGRVDIELARAEVWRPLPRRARGPAPLLRARLRRATAWLAQQRGTRSVIDGAAVHVTAALIAACCALDGPLAAQHAARLIGWGEGLTPAGDDYLVGLCAGLDAMLNDDPARATCRAAITEVLLGSLPRTTAISAHWLRLAAQGDYGERLLDARDALLSDAPRAEVDAALRAACAVGATSGADTLAGLLAALAAWPPTVTE